MFDPTLPPPAMMTYISRVTGWTTPVSQARTASVRVEIAVCVGQTVRRPRFA